MTPKDRTVGWSLFCTVMFPRELAKFYKKDYRSDTGRGTSPPAHFRCERDVSPYGYDTSDPVRKVSIVCGL